MGGLTAAPPADLVRLSVVARGRVADLAVPSRLPLAEIVPEVAAQVGILDAHEVHGGYALVEADGRELDPDVSLLAQGVVDGAVLSLVAGVDAAAPTVYDDVVEAVADGVDALGRGWGAEETRRATLVVSLLLIVVGAGGLVLQRGDGPAVPVAAAATTVLLLLAGAGFARGRRDVGTASVVLLGSGPCAVVAAVTATFGSVDEVPLLSAGVALAAVGALGAVVVPQGRWVFVPSVVVGSLVAVVGAVHLTTGLDTRRVVAVVLVGAVLLGHLGPWVAVAGASGLTGSLPPPSSQLSSQSSSQSSSPSSSQSSSQLSPVGAPVGFSVGSAVGSPVGSAVASRHRSPHLSPSLPSPLPTPLSRSATPSATQTATGPWVASATGGTVQVDVAAVRAGISRARGLARGLALGEGVAVAIGAPVLVGLGWAGLGLVWAGALVQVLRTRERRPAEVVTVGLVSGVLGATSGTVAALVSQPTWTGWIAAGAGGAGLSGLLVLGARTRPDRGSPRGGRVLDLLEAAALVALPPLLVLALDLVPAIGG